MNVNVFSTVWTPKGYKHPFVDHRVSDALSCSMRVSNWARGLEFRAKAERQPYYTLEVEVLYNEPAGGRSKVVGKFVNGVFHVKDGKEFVPINP